MTTYDTGLATKLGLNPESPPFNPSFNRWKEEILKGWNRINHYDANYRNDNAYEFLGFCEEHLKEHNGSVDHDNVLVLVHPLYLHLSHYGYIHNESMENEANKYLAALLSLLEERDSFSVVLLETAHHYATTSFWLEEDLVDKAIISLYDEGVPLKSNAFEALEDKNVFVAGGYNERCLSRAVNEIRIYNPDVKGLTGFCLNFPKLGRTKLISEVILCARRVPMVSLEELMEGES